MEDKEFEIDKPEALPRNGIVGWQVDILDKIWYRETGLASINRFTKNKLN